MENHQPIKSSLQIQFQSEKLLRVIKQCTDIEVLRQIASELVKLNEKKTAIADWATKRALDSEKMRISKL